MQVSDTLACSNGDYEVSRATEQSFGIEVTRGLGGELSRLTGGISASIGVTVTKSWTNDKTTTCAGGENESVCIRVAVPYRKVELSARKDGYIWPCKNGETAIGNFPVAGEANGKFYCVREKTNCHRDGDGYWVKK